jgi:hypothetical protein
LSMICVNISGRRLFVNGSIGLLKGTSRDISNRYLRKVSCTDMLHFAAQDPIKCAPRWHGESEVDAYEASIKFMREMLDEFATKWPVCF